MRRTLSCLSVLAFLLAWTVSSQAAIKVLYYDNFDGTPGTPLNGTVPDLSVDDTPWQAGSAIEADGTINPQFTAVLPFVPEVGTVYELSATFDVEGDWAAIGFLTEPGDLEVRILDNGPLLWSLTRPTGATNLDQAFLGPGTTGPLGDSTTSSAEELKIRLETTSETEWLVTWYFDDVQGFQETVNPADYDIQYVAFGGNGALNPLSGTAGEFKVAEVSGPPELAGYPDPADGATDVRRDAVLTWTAGEYAQAHDVYFGTVFTDVDAASRVNPMGVLVSQGQSDASHDPPGLLEIGQTYYWRVDEVNAAPENTIFKGEVWSFTTEPFAYPITGIIATSNGISEEEAGPENTVNGSGLNERDEHSVTAGDMWAAAPGEDPLWIQYEFDRVYKLHEMLVWNYNVMFEKLLGFGLKSVTVEYSLDGTDWTALGDFEFAQATATASYKANTTAEFGGLAVKYVRLIVNSGYGMMGQYGLSEVRFLYIPVQAKDPQPADGATVVDPDTALSWYPGREATTHEVYLGTDSQALPLVDTVVEPGYAPGPLDFGTTYYWQIVEVNNAQDIASWAGDIWSFSTRQYALIDGFETYNDDVDAATTIFDAWIDGWVNGNGSTVGYFDAPFAEQSIVHSGAQSMPLAYDNTASPFYSEAERTFEAAQDWTTNGANSISLYYRGVAPAFVETAEGDIVMNGIGADIWDTADQFRFAYKNLNGNGSIIARVDNLANSNAWAKAGVMIRESLEPGSAHAMVIVTPSNGVSFQRRPETDGASANTDATGLTAPYWVRLTRTGNAFTAQRSEDGVTWVDIEVTPTLSIPMASNVHVGLAVTSHDAAIATGAEFSNVSTTGNVTGTWQIAEIGAEQPEGNSAEPLYVTVKDSSGNIATVTNPDSAQTARPTWNQWTIPLNEFIGVNVSQVKTMTIGVGNPGTPTVGGTGIVYIDDIAYGRPAAAE